MKDRLITSLLALMTVCCVPVLAGTKITSSGNLTGTGINEVADQFQNILDVNGPAVANVNALANVAGYPVGKAFLGDFPSFTVGVSFNAALANMDTFDGEKTVQQGTAPVGSFNPAIFFGIGLSRGYDVLGKIMIFSSGFYRPPLDFSFATLSKLNLLSLGGKLRMNYFEKKTLLPGLLEFGGVTFSVGADLIYGTIGVEGEYEYPMKDVEVTAGAFTDRVSLDFKPKYSASVGWFITTVTVEAIAYLDIFWIFSLYTGFGLSAQYGSISLGVDAGGRITTNNATYIASNGGSNVVASNVGIASKNSYPPSIIMPEYIAGLDINLYLLRLSFETMVNLANRKDVNLQFGVRVQF